MVSLVPVFEELPQVTSSFWLHDKTNPGIPLFLRKGLQKRQTWSFAPQQRCTCASPFFPDLRSSKWFPSICCIGLSLCSSNSLRLFYSLGRKLSAFLVYIGIKCFIVFFHLSVLLSTKYSVLDFSRLNNQMHNKKRCIIYKLTCPLNLILPSRLGL